MFDLILKIFANTEDDGTGDGYVANDTFNISGDVVLYAQWNQSTTHSTPVQFVDTWNSERKIYKRRG